MKSETLKAGLTMETLTSKSDLTQFYKDLKDKNLIQSFEALPQNICGEKGKIKLPCTIIAVDGVPSFGFMNFGANYENEKLQKKSLATVKIVIPFDNDNYEVSATFTSEEEAKYIEKNVSKTLECLIRRASVKKEGEDFFRHYVSIVVPKNVPATTKNKTASQTVAED